MLTTLLMLAALQRSAPCVDLSGRYVVQGEDGRVHWSIAQTRCASVVITWESSMLPGEAFVHRLVLDGQFHPDRGWFGEADREQTSATLKSAALELVTKSSDGRTHTLRFARLADGDLCVTNERTSAKSPPKRASRQRTPDGADEDDAARRSAQGCVAP